MIKKDLEENELHPKVVLFYDGVCNVCNFSIQFILKHETKAELFFCALQSDAAILAGETFNINTAEMNSLLLYKDGKLLQKSQAVLHILPYLRWYFRILTVLSIIPRRFLDRVYDVVARNRYRWFGKKDTCMVPTPEIRERFVDNLTNLKFENKDPL